MTPDALTGTKLQIAEAALETLKSVGFAGASGDGDGPSAAGSAAVFVGSGITAKTIAEYLPFADGFIVGTAFKRDGNPAHPVDVHRVRDLMRVAGSV